MDEELEAGFNSVEDEIKWSSKMLAQIEQADEGSSIYFVFDGKHTNELLTKFLFKFGNLIDVVSHHKVSTNSNYNKRDEIGLIVRKRIK